MVRLTAKIKAVALIALALLIVVVSAFVYICKEKNYWQRNAAEYNYYRWSEIYLMTTELEELGFSRESISEMYLYANAKIFSSVTGIYPAIDGNSPYTSFLNTYYISLAYEIKLGYMTDEKSQEAIEIFKDATLALKELSRSILDMAEDEKNKLALCSVGSSVYNKAEEMVIEYCNNYGKKISAFNYSNKK